MRHHESHRAGRRRPARTSLLLVPVLPLLLTTGAAPGASAAPRAEVTVTIRAEGTDLSGSVRSTRATCRSDVTVVVVRQRGARGGGDDEPFASDTSAADGGWATGNTGVEGRFYARVRATGRCAADTSATVRAEREPS